jgi:hypothetical protein
LTFGVSSNTAIQTGAKNQTKLVSPFSGVINMWNLVSDIPCTATIDVWKNTVSPTANDSITGSAKPFLSASDFASSQGLTGWTTGVSAGDILQIEVESNTVATYLSLQLILNT